MAKKTTERLYTRLAESGLTPEHGKKLCLEELTADQVAKLGPNFDKRAGLRIPYFDATGHRTDFFRVRYLEPPTGFLASAKKVPRYVQPIDTLNEVYLPPLLGCTWEQILKDPDVPVYITEGEFKAAAGCSKDIPVIGLGGVDVFRAGKRGFPELLPVLENTVWKNRQVAIIWDSDIGGKPGAIAAQQTLAHNLVQRGAVPKLLAIPPGPSGKKMGLDDFLCASDAEDLKLMVAETTPFEEATHLWRMNEEVVLVLRPSMVLVRKTNQLLVRRDFTEMNYADRKYTMKVRKGSDEFKTVVKQTAKEWLEWPQRFAVESLTYAPGHPEVTERGEWNTWKDWGVESKPGDVGPFLELVDYVFTGAEPGAKEWFLRWCAYPIQHPGTKLFTAVLIHGVQHGTGKSFIGYILADIYGENASVIGNAELHGSFNGWARNKAFVMGEEVMGADKRDSANRLKQLITGETIMVNEKFLPAHELPNRINYFFTSNEPNAFKLQNSDRRFFVHKVGAPPHPGDLYKRVDRWRKNGGPSHLRHYLENLPLGDFDPKSPALATSAKADMVFDSKSEAERWIHELKENPDQVLPAAEDGCDLFTSDELYRAYNPLEDSHKANSTAFGNALTSEGIQRLPFPTNGQVKTKHGPRKLRVLRNQEKWMKASRQECAEHWEKYATMKPRTKH